MMGYSRDYAWISFIGCMQCHAPHNDSDDRDLKDIQG